MKNREKYKNELMDAIKKDGNICEFMIKHCVSKIFGKDMESFCGETACTSCTTALQIWLDEEYEEPEESEVDWDNVPVDTLVRVRDREDQEWILRYFKGIREDQEWILRYSKRINDKQLRNRYEAWESGATSKTADGKYLCWNFCELVEDEDNGCN